MVSTDHMDDMKRGVNMNMATLRVEGEVQAPREFAFAELAALPEQILDVGSLIPGRQGGAIWLRDLLDMIGVHPHATHVTLHATDGDYAASVPLAAIRDRALLVYRMGEVPLPVEQGGPIRFLITDAEACGLSEIDTCANVKFLGSIQVTQGPGVDTRPMAGR
jgi:DMSO/TMAO reductase YedYZ molybdopterin-dependent catalytic subunit